MVADPELLQYLDQNLPDAAIVISADGRVLHASGAVARLGGWRPADLVGRNGLELVHPDDLAYALGALAEVHGFPGEHAPTELRFLRADRTWIPALVESYNDPADPEGRVILSIRPRVDASVPSERRRQLEGAVLWLGARCAGAAIDDVEAVLDEVIARLGDVLGADEVRLSIGVDQLGRVEETSWQRDPLARRHLGSLADLDAVAAECARVGHPGRLVVNRRGTSTLVVEARARELVDGVLRVAWHRPDARDAWDEANLPLLEAGLRIVQLTIRRVARERLLTFHALHDPLTGLANRLRLITSIEHELGRTSGRDATGFAIGYCDLDGFKAINDRHGHAVGDEVLLAVSDALRSAVRQGDLVARVGGDEFVVLCPGAASPELAQSIASRMTERVAQPLRVSDGSVVRVTASVGVVRVVGHGGEEWTAERILHEADRAMYEAKAQPGRGTRLVTLELSPGLRAIG